MQDNPNHRTRKTLAELGGIIREKRKQAGYSSQGAAARALTVGKRFLSEVERGKETAEIGKILAVLHGLGLDLAVVEQSGKRTKTVTQMLGLDFPYDWSNTGIPDDVLIHNALEKGRFMDILRLARHYGIDRLERAAQAFAEAPNGPRLRQILARIRAGELLGLTGLKTAKTLVLADRIRSRDLFDLMVLMRDCNYTMNEAMKIVQTLGHNNDPEYYKAAMTGMIPLDRGDEGLESVDVAITLEDMYAFFNDCIADYEIKLAESYYSHRE